MRKPAIIVALTIAALLVASACGGGFDPTLRVTLEVDTTSLPQDTNVSETLDAVKEGVERRLDAFGASRKVTVEGENRLIVETSGITAEEAEDLIGRTGLLRFMEAEEDEAGLLICQTEEGERFSADYPAQVSDGVCTTAELTGEVVWKPATGIRAGEVRALTGRQVRAGSARANFDDVTGEPLVSIEFTSEGALLIGQITTRLSSPPRPLGIFLDDDLISSPRVTLPLTQSTTAITGVGTLNDAKNLAIQLNTSALPAPVRVVAIEEIPSDETSDGATITPSGVATVTPSDGAKPDTTSTPLARTPGTPPDSPPEVTGEEVALDSGLISIDFEPGTGTFAQIGDTVAVHYTGWVQDTGELFDSSISRGSTFQVTIGAGTVIEGWELGLAGMKEGGKRRLIIPPDLAYGDEGVGSKIPPGATLIFDVELVEILD